MDTKDMHRSLGQIAYEAYTASSGDLNHRAATVFADFVGTPSESTIEQLGPAKIRAAVWELCKFDDVRAAATSVLQAVDIEVARDFLRKHLVCPPWEKFGDGDRAVWAAIASAVTEAHRSDDGLSDAGRKLALDAARRAHELADKIGREPVDLEAHAAELRVVAEQLYLAAMPAGGVVVLGGDDG